MKSVDAQGWNRLENLLALSFIQLLSSLPESMCSLLNSLHKGKLHNLPFLLDKKILSIHSG